MTGKPKGGRHGKARRGPDVLTLEVLERIERDRAFARPVLDALFSRERLPRRDRAAITRQVRGTLQWRIQLDHLLDQRLPKGLDGTEPRVGWILRLGAFLLLHDPKVPTWAAVTRAVDLAKASGRRGMAGLVNGVLRALGRQAEALPYPDPAEDPAGHVSVAGSVPRWLAARWVDELGLDEALALALSLNEAPRFTVRVVPPASRDDLTRVLAEQDGTVLEPCRWAPDGLVVTGGAGPALFREIERGSLVVQDEASILVGHLVAPERGDRVLDCCAAPGGKARHLASMLDEGVVLARDLGRARMRFLGGLEPGSKLVVQERDLLAPPLPEDLGAFQRVLLDAPCSNLGTLRRHPEAKARISPDVVAISAERQAALLQAAAKLVAEGGVLVYSVCSVTREEGWGVVDGFLGSDAGAGFRVEAPASRVFEGLLDERGAMVTWPHRHDMDGFFAVRLRRIPKP